MKPCTVSTPFSSNGSTPFRRLNFQTAGVRSIADDLLDRVVDLLG
jgi:hypothetical protein